MKKKIKHTELIAELKKRKAENKTTTQVAQEMQKKRKAESNKKEKAVKVREVKDFIVVKNKEQLAQDTRQVIKEHRNYMLNSLTEDDTEVYNATLFKDENAQLQLLTQQIANTLVQQFVAKLAVNSKFNAQDIMKLHSTRGGAYGDKIRKALYSLSYSCTLADIADATKYETTVETAKTKNKLLLQYNLLPDSRRARYEFIKIQ